MRKAIITFLLIFAAIAVADAQVVVVSGGNIAPASSKKESDKDKVRLNSSLKEATFKRDIKGGFIIPYDDEGNPLDTIKAFGYRWNGSGVDTTSFFSVPVQRGDTLIVFDAGAPGYQTQTVSWSFKPFGKREFYREMPPIFLSKVHQLKEVTVTASKVKFYNKGDTVVYDADAFQLADGSMLDALITQLPGAEIDENGRITINGEFVESLLLNGKDFFDKDHSLMLENIPAYTVKTVEVYKGHNKEEKLRYDQSKPQHLTMDVKLKKEYSHGWIINAQGGYGTADRYMARLFASWFSPTTSVVITGLANNLNDNRTPGKNDSWTPESMPSGKISNRSASIRYDHKSVDQTVEANGSFNISGRSTDYSQSTSSTQFLSGTNTYGRDFSDSKSSNFSISTYHTGTYTTSQKHRFSMMVTGDYSKSDDFGNSLSATFNSDYSDISRQALDAIYSDAPTDALKAIVNRALNLSEGSLRSGSVNVLPYLIFKLPNSNESIYISGGFEYVGSKRRGWNDYIINFGEEANPAERRRQYTDESPNYRKEWSGSIGYGRPMKNGYLSLGYDYTFSDKAKDSYMYALDRLEDMGVFGILPEGYASTLDPTNSYTSTTRTSSHRISVSYSWHKFREKDGFIVYISPNVAIKHHHFDYWRENRSYLVKRTSVVFPRVFGNVMLRYSFGKSESAPQGNYNNEIGYGFNIETNEPELLHLVDVVSDANPLNIQEGNPDLKNSFRQTHNLTWRYSPFGKPVRNSLGVSYSNTANNLVRGYTYDTQTGVRRYRTYNVDGNYSYSATNYLSWEFGKQKQFSLSSSTNWSLTNYADMMGINAEAPTKAQVRTNMISEDIKFGYKIGKQTISLFGQGTNRHTTSERPDFNTINAQHYKYGVSGIFALPAGFGISTDLSFYKRVGYGVKELDTTDAVWNMRLTYTPRGNNHWVFSADGFDLLHKLSNVHYSVSATGRTVTYTNTLPRYFILTVQYRLNIQPKK